MRDGGRRHPPQLLAGDFLGLRRRGTERFPGNGHPAGPGQFFDSQRLKEIDDRFDLFRITRDFNRISRGSRIDDIRAEDIGDP